ncbi:hypothetical protein [Blastococcus sp. TF02A-35]|uniref:hypothetical protein n=1 Tax=Blastococcus sp. TF02A-35 TaxID=2559612 RepID=UPI0010743BE6|nr:hypothetical protein [Blastococcus sp. TF02A_35]TFV49531.1 hypothetical protein E4P43_11830 [Blastococcus sp. TF02A_35]
MNADQVLRSLQQRVELSGELRAHDLEALRTWMELVSRLSKAVLDAKVDERRMRLSEQTAAEFVVAMKAVLVALGHDPSHPAVLRVVSTQLRALDAGAGA